MKVKIALIAFLFFLFYSPFVKSVFAAITFTTSNPQLNGEEVTFDISIAGLTSSSCPNTSCFLQAAFTPQTTTHYFGLTKNHNNDWFEYISSPETAYIQSTFFSFQPISGSWSGSLTIRPDTNDSYYTGTTTYNIKTWRYTGNSKSYSGASDNTLSIELTAPTPTPTNAPTPTSAPASTSTPVPTSTPTPKPTPTLTPTPSLTPTPVLPTEILGESTKSATPTSTQLEVKTTGASKKKTEVLGKQTSSTPPKILLGLGSLFLIACGILFLRFYIKNKKQQGF